MPMYLLLELLVSLGVAANGDVLCPDYSPLSSGGSSFVS